MAVKVTEKLNSRRSRWSESPTAELRYHVQGTMDDLLVRDRVLARSPRFYAGLIRNDVDIDPVDYELWEATVNYGKRKEEEERSRNPLLNLGFEIGTETSHITQSRRTPGKYALPGARANDYEGAIGYDGESVQGTDIMVPTFQFTQQRILPIETVTFGFVRALFYLTGRVNSGAFLGFETGEVLFLGAGGTRSPEGDWDLTYRFAASPNVKNLTVGKIRGINKRGWEYLWVRYMDSKDANVLVKVPFEAYVEEVYQAGNFNILGIGS